MPVKRKRIQRTVPAQESASTDPLVDLREEIEMLREMIRRVNERAGDDLGLGETLRMLDMVSRSCTRLADLLKAQREIEGSREAAMGLSEAMDEAIRSLINDTGAGR